MAENYSPLETQGSKQRPSRYRWSASVLMVLFIVAAVATYAWYYLRSSCEVNAVQEASAILVIQTKSFDGVYQVATSASPTSLISPVSVLQQILMDTQEVAVPACMKTEKSELINYMGTVIRAFQAFAARETDATVRDLITQSNKHYDNFFAELKAVNKCAPYCIP